MLEFLVHQVNLDPLVKQATLDLPDSRDQEVVEVRKGTEGRWEHQE